MSKRNGSATKVRMFLPANAGAGIEQIAAAIGVTVEQARGTLNSLIRHGFVTRLFTGYFSTGKVRPPQMTEKQREEARRKYKREWWARNNPGMVQIPRVARPKAGPKPPRVIPNQAIRSVMDAGIARAARIKVAPLGKRPDTEAFLRANPDKLVRLASDAPWSKPEKLSETHRRVIRGVV